MNILSGMKFNFPLLWEEETINEIYIRRGLFEILTSTPIIRTYMGFDPGQTNMGLACFKPIGKGALWQVRFPSNLSSVDRIILTNQVMNLWLDRIHPEPETDSIIENASFGSPYGQAPLSENRTIIANVLLMDGYDVGFIPPLSIRKHVFGSAKIKAEETWPGLAYKGHNDVASALACALYGYEMRLPKS